MGCGQSKIGNIYSKNKKNKSNSAKKNSDSIHSSSIDQKNSNTKNNKTNNNGVEVNRNEDESCPIDNKNLTKKKPAGSANGPLLHQTEVSSSQVDFFKMLDEKIENGPDYDENMDSTIRAKHVTDLLRRWELSSIWPSVNDLNNATSTVTTTVMSTNAQGEPRERTISAKEREGMRNIIGGRPEITTAFARNANRVDGLKDFNCPSPHMPRHVLESITQSPTQSLKNPISPGTSSHSRQYHDYIDDNNSTVVNKFTANKLNSQLQRNSDDEDDYINSQALYREQYLQQTGIISVQSQYQSGNIIHNNSYVQQFQRTNNQQHCQTPNKHNVNVIQMT